MPKKVRGTKPKSLPKDIELILKKYTESAYGVLRHSFSGNLRGDGFSSDTTSFYGQRKIRIIDLFSGAGGFTLGFTQTGRVEPVFANDFDAYSVKTYNANFGDHCSHADINVLLANKSVKFPEADVVIGGPPCQGFSLLNKQREGDPRKQLWKAFMEVIRRVKPKVFVMENVKELLNSPEYHQIQTHAESMGYMLTSLVLNAADYGVPQRRRRAIVLASKGYRLPIPYPTHGDPKKPLTLFDRGLLPWETVGRAIGDLSEPEGIDISVGKIPPPMDLHFGRTPTTKSLARYKCIPEGGNRFDLQKKRPDLTPDCWKKKKSGGTDLFGRLWWIRPGVTIRTEFFKPEKGRYLHPKQQRPITHREAARLQSFPDNFMFLGTKIEVAKQIGNAVPPLLAKSVAELLLKYL